MLERTQIGTIGVDAGLCWIGDPCYTLPDDALHNPGSDWGEFCRAIEGLNYKQFWQGMVVSTGHGDGEYPVYAIIEKGLIHSVTVQFIREKDGG
jgi:hypothetical protein